MRFKKKYTQYWEGAIKSPIDGLYIAGLKEVKTFLPLLKIGQNDKVLDLGCSYGRMYELLAEYSDNISGVDPDPYAVEKARTNAYEHVHTGTAEKTGFDSKYFDVVFCWAVYDVVDQQKGLLELNRILKKGGRFLVTGKNNNYLHDDEFAYNAEKNAFLKDFPNHFTDLRMLVPNLHSFGFALDKLIIFPRRGDLGLLKYVEVDPALDEFLGYEYMILGQKVTEPEKVSTKIDSPFSLTSQVIAIQKGYATSSELFKSEGIHYEY